jgi:LacI family transcriptional regulator
LSPEDVARRARVSPATVSRVLNDIGVVKSTTRTRVLKAIQELKYYPNAHARALAGGVSRTLGLIVSNLENPFFLDIFRVLEEEAHTNGYEVLVANTDYDSQWLNSSVRIMLGRRVAGIALVVSEADGAILDELHERKIRTVVYDVGSPRRSMLSIKSNYRKGIERVSEYLRSLRSPRCTFPGDAIGRQIFASLTTQKPPGKPQQEIVITPELVVRESTGRAANEP